MPWLVIFIVLILIMVVAPRVGLISGIVRWRQSRRQMLIEHALKFLNTAETDSRIISSQGLAGGLGISPDQSLALVEKMESAGLIKSAGGALKLTEDGNELAIHMVRAHRLWERYLADEARLPLDKVHQHADRFEHFVTTQQLDALSDHLGNPFTDPHGDPIPNARGIMIEQDRSPLTDWPMGEPARIVHIEDEPVETMRSVFAAGLRPNIEISVLDRNNGELVIATPAGEQTISAAIATGIHVRALDHEAVTPSGSRRLSTLGLGETANVLSISERCQGLSRRRLLDLGLTPGAVIKAELASPMGSATGYRIRGTLIALRSEQADMIWIRQASGTPVEHQSTA